MAEFSGPGQNPNQQYPNQQYPYIPNQHQPKEKAGCWGIGGSFLIPILGVILFFVQKDKELHHNVFHAIVRSTFATSL